MLGVGPDGRKYLLERPSHEEMEHTMWRIVCDARLREEDLKKELKDQNEQWQKEEKNL